VTNHDAGGAGRISLAVRAGRYGFDALQAAVGFRQRGLVRSWDGAGADGCVRPSFVHRVGQHGVAERIPPRSTRASLTCRRDPDGRQSSGAPRARPAVAQRAAALGMLGRAGYLDLFAGIVAGSWASLHWSLRDKEVEGVQRSCEWQYRSAPTGQRSQWLLGTAAARSSHRQVRGAWALVTCRYGCLLVASRLD
jgi:hypothetical protein